MGSSSGGAAGGSAHSGGASSAKAAGAAKAGITVLDDKEGERPGLVPSTKRERGPGLRGRRCLGLPSAGPQRIVTAQGSAPRLGVLVPPGVVSGR